jgi:hypothetical protein
MICCGLGGCLSRCLIVSSWSRAMIALQEAIVQLRLDLASNPASVVAVWALLEEERQRAAMALLAALIAQAVCDEGEKARIDE